MADTTVTNETAATTPTGAELVRIVQGGSSKKTTLAVAGHQFRGARARMSSDDTAQNYTTAADVPMDVADFDTDGFWSAGSPARLTIPAGKGITHVVVTAQLQYSSSTADTWKVVAIRHRDSANTVLTQSGLRNVEMGFTGGTICVSTGPLAVSDGDYFALLLQEESDTSITIEGDNVIHTYISLHVIGMEPV